VKVVFFPQLLGLKPGVEVRPKVEPRSPNRLYSTTADWWDIHGQFYWTNTIYQVACDALNRKSLSKKKCRDKNPHGSDVSGSGGTILVLSFPLDNQVVHCLGFLYWSASYKKEG
jgi:hypothetical protein